MIPSRRLIVLFALLTLPLLLGGVSRSLADVALIANLILVITAIIDLLISPSTRELDIERKVSKVLSVAANNPVQLLVKNKSKRTVNLTLHDDTGPLCETVGLPKTIELPSWKDETVNYHVQPTRRGATKMLAVHLRFPTRLGLWLRHEARTLEDEVRIYPDIRAVYRYELMARRNRLAEIGVRMVRMPGQGRDFERLREFRYGDEIRQVDWKATSRQRKLISREYNVERNQNIVLMVDCGRFMRNETGGISYLDRALNAAIMLSYIALGQGDNVSLMAFSNKVERFIRPVRGTPGIQSILHSTYDIEAADQVSDYSMALEHLSIVQRKRALVIMITFITDEMQLDVIKQSLSVKSISYLPMCVLLQDVGLRQMADRVPQTDLDAYHTAAAANILSGQTRKAAALRESGVLLIDTPPDLLTERLINEYLTIKARNML